MDKLRKIIEDYLREYWSKKWQVLMDGGNLLFVYGICENFKLFYDDEIQNWCLDSMRHEIPLDILSDIYKILVNDQR